MPATLRTGSLVQWPRGQGTGSSAWYEARLRTRRTAAAIRTIAKASEKKPRAAGDSRRGETVLRRARIGADSITLPGPRGGRSRLLGLDDGGDDDRPPVEGLAEIALQVALDEGLHDAPVGALLRRGGLDAPAHRARGLAQDLAAIRADGKAAAEDFRLALEPAGVPFD